MDEIDLAQILRSCLNSGGRASWESFIKCAQPVVAAGVLRSLANFGAARRDLADDLIQETFLKLCANDFRLLRNIRAQNTGAVYVYLKTVAATTVIDHFRSHATLRKGAGKAAANLDDLAAITGAPDKSFEALETAMMIEQVEKCLSRNDDRDRRIFWLYHRQEMKPKTIASLPGIGLGTGGVETAVYRLTRGVRDCLKKGGFLQSALSQEGEHA